MIDVCLILQTNSVISKLSGCVAVFPRLFSSNKLNDYTQRKSLGNTAKKQNQKFGKSFNFLFHKNLSKPVVKIFISFIFAKWSSQDKQDIFAMWNAMRRSDRSSYLMSYFFWRHDHTDSLSSCYLISNVTCLFLVDVITKIVFLVSSFSASELICDSLLSRFMTSLNLAFIDSQLCLYGTWIILSSILLKVCDLRTVKIVSKDFSLLNA